MEMNELRYFLSAAKHQNIHAAAKELHISPGSVSKAISRLEQTLNTKLFERVGRGIVVSDTGRLFQRKAAQILNLIENVQEEISGSEGFLKVKIAGPEALLSYFSGPLIQAFKKYKIQQNGFQIKLESIAHEDILLQKVLNGQVDFALTSLTVPENLVSKPLDNCTFQTCIGKKHPLADELKPKDSIHISELLRYSFACPDAGILGKLDGKKSADGWRDDKFQRKIDFICPTLKILENIVVSGLAVAYLPSFLVQNLGLQVLKVDGCSYSCKQSINLVANTDFLPFKLRALFP